MTDSSQDLAPPENFLQQVIRNDLEEGRVSSIQTRFPPEPNGYLHIGHAKSICLNFGLAEQFNGQCNLRFDDTNPVKEDQHFVESIKSDVKWLGFNWNGEVRYASSYFDQLYDWAQHLIRHGNAYVCDLSADEAREYRGTLTEPGRASPYRDRSVDENLALFKDMREGKFADGEKTLRAKIDMANGNINLRDPILYRIMHSTHHQTGNEWPIYPTYDYAHGQEDAIEGVTHSICTLEFADHKPLYDWLLEHLPVPSKPRQYEFARLNLNYTVTSKRKLKQLVDQSVVDGWDDPRMPTIAGMRRAGFSARAIRNFCDAVGVTRSDSVNDVAQLEHALRDDLDKNAPRAMCVIDPLKLVITNYPDDKYEQLEAPPHPHRDDIAGRVLPFGRTLYIEKEDFRESANKKYKRLVIGKRVRLRGGYIIEAQSCSKNADGDITEVQASLIEGTLGADPEDGIKAKGVIHWVAAHENVPCTIHLYERLFNAEQPGKKTGDFMDDVNPDSLTVVQQAYAEISLSEAEAGISYQFERLGYFCLDKGSSAESIVFNRTISLRDSYSK